MPGGEAVMDCDEPIAVVLAADEQFAMPLAVTVKSAINARSSGCAMHFYILDAGFSSTSRSLLADSWKAPGVSVSWLRLDMAQFDELPVSGHLSRAAYSRIMMAEMLPESLERVMYLDADMLIRRGLEELWLLPFGSSVCLAVQDVGVPWLNSEIVLANYEQCRQYIPIPKPVPNYEEFGMSGTAPYFNSGLLVVDLKKWRLLEIGQQALSCLKTHKEHALWLDQYALNVVLYDRWRPIDMRWNQGAHIYLYPDWQNSPLDSDSFKSLRDDPFIVHFSSCCKPWHRGCAHPWSNSYFAVLDQTAWAGWRPGTRIQRLADAVRRCVEAFRHGVC